MLSLFPASLNIESSSGSKSKKVPVINPINAAKAESKKDVTEDPHTSNPFSRCSKFVKCTYQNILFSLMFSLILIFSLWRSQKIQLRPPPNLFVLSNKDFLWLKRIVVQTINIPSVLDTELIGSP